MHLNALTLQIIERTTFTIKYNFISLYDLFFKDESSGNFIQKASE